MSITITPLIVPPRTPALQPQAFLEPSWTNGKRSREDEDGTFDDAKRPRICPPLADALAFLASDAWPTELYVPSTPSSTTDTDSHSENNLDMTGTQSTDSISDGVSDSSSPPIVQTALSSEENYKFESDDDLLAWVLSLPVIDDELGEGDSLISTNDTPSSPSTSNIPASPPTSNASASPCPSPLPIFSVEDDRISTQPTSAQLLHYIPPPTTSARKVRGSPRRNVDTEDLRKNVANNLRWQWFFGSETPTSPAFYERDLPPCETPGTPPGNIGERTKLEPPASAYRYTLDPNGATSSATRRDDSDTRSDEYASGYSASELFGPDADTVKVARCAPVRPRAVIDLCELTTVEHTLRHRADEATTPSSTVEVYADACAVEFWKASANEVVEHVRAQKAAEETARLEAELRAFFEDAAAAEDEGEGEGEDDSDMEAVEIPDRESEAEAEAEAEANASFDAEDDSTGSESSGEEEDGGLFDYGQWVADCVLL